VALSSCEDEYIAASAAACQGVWLGRLFVYLMGEEVHQVLLKIDNQSVILSAKTQSAMKEANI
jgi:hypothetical protein